MGTTILTTQSSTEEAIALSDLIQLVRQRTDRVHGENVMDQVIKLLEQHDSAEQALATLRTSE
jgi:hypothetical protein